jgi:hypothetical protein
MPTNYLPSIVHLEPQVTCPTSSIKNKRPPLSHILLSGRMINLTSANIKLRRHQNEGGVNFKKKIKCKSKHRKYS